MAVKHGQKGTRLYEIWHGMKQRCLNPNLAAYKNYGARGIKVCEAWMEFERFFDWAIDAGYKKNLSLDRIDVNGNYCPENCRWITLAQQQTNKRTNILCHCRGETHCIAEWSRISGISEDRIRSRLLAGWPEEYAIFKPVRKKKPSAKKQEEYCS